MIVTAEVVRYRFLLFPADLVFGTDSAVGSAIKSVGGGC